MDSDGSSTRTGVAIAIGVAFIAVTVAAAVVFTNRQGASVVAEQGSIALQAETAIGAVSAVRNGAAQTVLIAELQPDGGVGADQRAALRALRDEFGERVGELQAVLPEESARSVAAEFEVFDLALQEFVEATGGTELQTQLDMLDRSYGTVVGVLAEIRDAGTAELIAARDEAGRVADAARFFVAFFIPMGAVLAFRRRARREQERRDLEVQLESEREIGRSKDEFIANLSHELRTPLTGIYGFALALEADGLDEPTTARELVGLIADESAELTRMVDDLIAVGRLESGEIDYFPEPIHPKAEIDSVLAAFVRSGRAFQVMLEDDLVMADPGRFRQLVRNLVSNAVKHGGPEVQILGRVDDASGCYRVEVIDDGPGVPDHVAERIFERYVHRGSQPLLAGSVGLGLSIAHSFAAGMGGALRYERRNDETVFSFELPLAEVA